VSVRSPTLDVGGMPHPERFRFALGDVRFRGQCGVIDRRVMSALGHKQTLSDISATPALPPRPDITICSQPRLPSPQRARLYSTFLRLGAGVISCQMRGKRGPVCASADSVGVTLATERLKSDATRHHAAYRPEAGDDDWCAIPLSTSHSRSVCERTIDATATDP